SGKDLEIADNVGDQEADEDDSGDRHHDLLPDHGVPKGGHAMADNHASGRHVCAKLDRRTQILCVLHIKLSSFGCFIAFATATLGKWGSIASRSLADEALPRWSCEP